MTISRSDIYMRDEKGGQWFEDFLQQFASTVKAEEKETVSSVVDKYKHLTGLDKIASHEDSEKSVVVLIEDDADLKSSLHSILENSGGKRGTHAVISFLREMLGNDLVSYSDDDLVGYIDDMKSKYDTNYHETVDVGKIGTEPPDLQKADFMEHGKGM